MSISDLFLMSRLQNFVYYRSHITHPLAVVKNKKKCLVFKNEKAYLFSSVNYDINVFVIPFFVCFKTNVIPACTKYIDLYISAWYK